METLNPRNILLGMLLLTLGLSKSWFQMAEPSGSIDMALLKASPDRAPAQARPAATQSRPPGQQGQQNRTPAPGGPGKANALPAGSASSTTAAPAPAPAPAAASSTQQKEVKTSEAPGTGTQSAAALATTKTVVLSGNAKIVDSYQDKIRVNDSDVTVTIAKESKPDFVVANDKDGKAVLAMVQKEVLVATFTTAEGCSDCIDKMVIAQQGDFASMTAALKEHATNSLNKKLAANRKEKDLKARLDNCDSFLDEAKKEIKYNSDSKYMSDRIACFNNMDDDKKRSEKFHALVDEVQEQLKGTDSDKERKDLLKLAQEIQTGIVDNKLKKEARLMVTGVKDTNRIIELAAMSKQNPNSSLTNSREMDMLTWKYNPTFNTAIKSYSESLKEAYADWNSFVTPIASAGIKDPMLVLRDFLPEFYSAEVTRGNTNSNIPRGTSDLNGTVPSATSNVRGQRVQIGSSNINNNQQFQSQTNFRPNTVQSGPYWQQQQQQFGNNNNGWNSGYNTGYRPGFNNGTTWNNGKTWNNNTWNNGNTWNNNTWSNTNTAYRPTYGTTTNNGAPNTWNRGW